MTEFHREQPIGKWALQLAMSEGDAEEKEIKALVNSLEDTAAAVTFISGVSSQIATSYTKSIVSTALSMEVVKKNPGHIHALIHASLEALHSIISLPSVSTSLKIKIAIVSNRHWVAVAAYGYSAFSVYTNHERAGLGIMHL